MNEPMVADASEDVRSSSPIGPQRGYPGSDDTCDVEGLGGWEPTGYSQVVQNGGPIWSRIKLAGRWP